MPKSKKALPVKVGDVVEITLPHRSKGGAEPFTAKVLEIKENMSAHLIVRYERTVPVDDNDFDLCHVDFITEIVEAAPYVVKYRPKINIFSEHAHHGARRINRRLYAGPLVCLMQKALASVKHVELKQWLIEDRAEALFQKDGCPGKVSSSSNLEVYEWEICVNWKVFRSWVHANALRLIANRAEYMAQIRTDEREAWEQAMDNMDEVMDRAFG